jgi:hypothetical protein
MKGELMFKKLYIALILILILSSWARAEDVKITELPAATSMAVGDIFVIVADPTGSAVTKKITLGNVTATPGAIGAGTPSAGNFTTLGAGAGGFTVDADGDVVGKGFSTPQLTTADNIQLRPGSGATNPTYYRGWAGAPQPVTGFTLYNFPNADPAAGSIMQFGAVSSNVSQVTWLTPGTDVATFLATPSSANLLGALTDETGTGAAVFANTPTLVTPVIGSATGTSLVLTGVVDALVTTTVGSGAISQTAKNTYTICTAACQVTIPVASAGQQHCVRNAPNTTGAITLVNRASQYYELTTHAAWATANQKLVSGGAVTDSICVVGYDATHYATMSFVGTWTDTAP